MGRGDGGRWTKVERRERKKEEEKNLDGSRIILAYLTLPPFTFSPFVPLPTLCFSSLFSLRIFDLGLH